MPVMSGGHLGVRRFISAFQSHVSVIPGFALHQEQAGCPEGSEYRTSGLRMAPGDVAHVPRTPSPVAEAGPVAGHFRSRARLRRLLVRLRRPTPQRSLRSLRRRGFALYVRLRHYRSSLFCCRKIIPSHSFAALTALVVRRENGLGDQPMFASARRRTPPVGALACAPGSGTLPPPCRHLAATLPPGCPPVCIIAGRAGTD